jgi:hypothetical protein
VLWTTTIQENLLKAIGILLLALVILFLFTPCDVADYTIVGPEFWGITNTNMMVKTAYDYNNKSDILRFPKQLDNWRGYDFSYPERIYEALEGDVLLSRMYWNGSEVIWIDILHSKTAKSFHNPRICYGSQFNITNEKIVDFNVVGNRSYIALSKMYGNSLELINKRNSSDKQVVFYWYMYKIFGKEQGTTMIRLSASVNNSTEETFELMKSFVEKQLFSEMYEKGMMETKIIGETLIAKYGALGIVVILVLLFIPIGLVFNDRFKRL